MAKRFLTPINVLNAASDPVSAAEGDLYYNTATDKLRIYSNSEWVDVSSGGGSGVTSLTGTTNEVEVSASTGAITISLPETINANTTGSAATLTTSRTISLSGDVSGSASFNGGSNASISATLANSGVSANSYGSASAVPTLTVDAKGRLTAASNTAIAISQSAVTNLTTDLGLKANLASPALTGTPTAPTAAVDTNTTQIATTAYVVGQAGSATPLVNGTAAVGTSTRYARQDHVHPTDTSRAPLASPALTGTPTAPTATVDTNTTQIATTAYVVGQGYLKSATAASTYAPISSPTFTGTVTVPTPNNPTDAATKAYVDSVAEGLHIHASVAAATTASVSLTTPPATIDGVTLTNNMRVLVKNQTNTAQNGVYVFSTSTGQLSRASDFDSAAEIDGGDFVFVTGGTVNDNTGWVQTETVTNIGTDPIIFTQFSGAGTYTAGTGLLLTGSVFSNTGVLSLTGTEDQVTVSASTGNITLSIPSTIARLASPAFSGTPTAPTAAANTNSTQIATTAFVLGQGNSTAATIAMNGTQAAGTSNLYARADHIHPSDTTRAALSGATFTGTIVAPAATTSLAPIRIPHGTAPSSPTNGDIWTTTAGLFARINNVTVGPFSSGGGATVSNTSPSSPINGQLWYNSSNGKTYIYYQDGTSNQWVEVGTASISPLGNYDGGDPDTNYGGIPALDGGGVT